MGEWFLMIFNRKRRNRQEADKANSEKESGGRGGLIGYRFEATGVYGCRFYKNGDIICSVSSAVMPSAPVLISGNGIKWRSDFGDSTIVPGISRIVIDDSNGKEVFRIVYRGTGEYEINESVKVRCGAGEYAFYRDGSVIANIDRINDKPNDLQKMPDTYYDYEPCFEVTADNGIQVELLTVILAFPMLQFAL